MAANPLPPRTRSARLTLVSLLLIPMLSLAALWGFTASITLGNLIRYEHYNTVITTISPSVTALEETLPVERALTLVWLGDERRPGTFQAQLATARRGTDTYAPAVRRAVMSVRGLLGAKGTALMNIFLADLARLGQIRAGVDAGAYDAVTAYNAYSTISTAEIQFFQNASPPADPDLGLMTQAAIAEARAQDDTGGAISLIAGAITGGGLMPQPERVLLAQVVGQQEQEIGDTFSLATPVLTALFRRVYDLPAYRGLQAIENQVEASPVSRPVPVDVKTFETDAQTIQAAVRANGAQVGTVLGVQSTHLRDSVATELALAAGLGLAAVAASVFVMVRFGRRLRVELGNLYEVARQTAGERLPRLVERLRRGEDVDVEAESPPPKAARITEIADVAQAFSTVQRTAAEAAVGQASLRKGVNQVFVNLSLRNQSLLHRQLGMLDEMERATSDPAVLADLFRLDHLTTRMRRHAEGLLILSGTVPGRGWRDPVPVADVLHAAIAEVEDFVRVDVITDSADAVVGPAVNDVIHLIAELAENATAFSPPNTRVEIRGGSVAHGFAVEVEDRGLGMAPDVMDAVNGQLASPPEFDLANSDRLGLFVAGQLAARHGIKVTLCPSPYGGTRAVVLLPQQIIVPEEEAAAWFGPGSTGELPAAVDERTRGPGPAGSQEHGTVFGVTGRNRLALTASPEDGATEETGPGSPTAADDGTYLGLPRRVRLANLAPQLRGQAGGEPSARLLAPLPARNAAEPAGLSPEQAGSRLAALQEGWRRGRLDDINDPGAAPEPGWQPSGMPADETGPNDQREADS